MPPTMPPHLSPPSPYAQVRNDPWAARKLFEEADKVEEANGEMGTGEDGQEALMQARPLGLSNLAGKTCTSHLKDQSVRTHFYSHLKS